MNFDRQTGTASGWMVWPDKAEWRWRAWFGSHVESGTGTSELNCQSQARRARDELKRRQVEVKT